MYCFVSRLNRFCFFLLLHIQCGVVIEDRFPPTKAPDVKTFPNIDNTVTATPPSRPSQQGWDCTVFPTGLPFPPVKGNIFPGCRGSLIVSKTEGPVRKQFYSLTIVSLLKSVDHKINQGMMLSLPKENEKSDKLPNDNHVASFYSLNCHLHQIQKRDTKLGTTIERCVAFYKDKTSFFCQYSQYKANKNPKAQRASLIFGCLMFSHRRY